MSSLSIQMLPWRTNPQQELTNALTFPREKKDNNCFFKLLKVILSELQNNLYLHSVKTKPAGHIKFIVRLCRNNRKRF